METKTHDEIWSEIVDLIEDEFLNRLLVGFWLKHSEPFGDCIGSSRYHHSYKGGLLDHTENVVNLSIAMAKQYPDVDMDVIITGAALHDIGKMSCYEKAPPLKTMINLKDEDGKVVKGEDGEPVKVPKPAKYPYQRSEQAKVMDHFGEALILVNDIVHDMLNEGLTIDPRRLRPVLHIIASHHGEPRWGYGSMVSPSTDEAWIVAMADMISSKVGLE